MVDDRLAATAFIFFSSEFRITKPGAGWRAGLFCFRAK
jgi:hypothetical protein